VTTSALHELFSLEGRTALVTGAATGIGRALAVGMARCGANVALLHHHEAVDDVRREILACGRACAAHPLDLETLAEAEAVDVLRKFEAELGPVDVLINNAGVNPRRMSADYAVDDLDRAFGVNVRAPFILSRALVASRKLRSQSIQIIQVLSLLAFRGGFRTTGYTSTKHALLGLTRLLANEWGSEAVRVNAIAPGYIRTRMTEEFMDAHEISDPFLARIPVGRWGTPTDLVGAAVFLASPAAAYVHGATLVVDGGYLNS
jgi:2-dehydro-3-deoxy-D-gluconate 5-dehydrogenase